MEKFQIVKDNRCYPVGTAVVEGGVHFSIVSQDGQCSLVLYRPGRQTPVQKLPFPEEGRIGDVWGMTVAGDFSKVEYCFEMNGRLTEDPFGRHFSGRELWGSSKHLGQVLRASVPEETYDWEGDQLPEIPYEECILYRLHPRGFTKHSSSGVKERGTFAGIAEKIPYFLELGVTTIELMPSIEFQEVMAQPEPDSGPADSGSREVKPNGKVNYWGFVPGLYFAPKASYCSGKEKHPERELKDLIKALHKAGLELVMDLFFTGEERETFVLEVLRFWAREYHVDGFHLIGAAPCRLAGQDPFLSRVKLFAWSWEGVRGGRFRHLAEYNDGFAVDMKRFLKGDENQVNRLAFRTRHNPKDRGVVNYMANVDGFTLMDNVCYEMKHNEANGENNLDGTDYNHSWNCGVEGPSRKKKVVQMRRRLLRASYLLTFLSQGTPLLLAGDEFGNSKNGNNNSYCQDNEISWLNWNQKETNRDLLEFVKAVIRFRKSHPMFHLPQEPRIMDYLSCGQPDVSYHGVNAWCPEFENFRRQLGILYCGRYGKLPDGTTDDYFYAAYNMHWEPHEFSIPNLPKNRSWHIAMDTGAEEVNGIYPEGQEPLLKRQKYCMVEPRTIMVLVGKEISQAPEAEEVPEVKKEAERRKEDKKEAVKQKEKKETEKQKEDKTETEKSKEMQEKIKQQKKETKVTAV